MNYIKNNIYKKSSYIFKVAYNKVIYRKIIYR